MATTDPPLHRSGSSFEFRLTIYWLVFGGVLALLAFMRGHSLPGVAMVSLVTGASLALPYAFELSFRRQSAKAQSGRINEGSIAAEGADPAPRPRFQLRIWNLAVLVAGCAMLLGMDRSIQDQFAPENAPARALRALRSSDSERRAAGALELDTIVIMDRPTTTAEMREALVEALLAARRDDHAEVRLNVVRGLLHVVTCAKERSQAIPHLEDVVAAMIESLGDAAPAVRWHAGLGLSNVYNEWSNQEPLPRDPGPLTDALILALRDPDRELRTWPYQALVAIAPRLAGTPPPALVAALEAPAPATRALAAHAVVAFPEGLDAVLPTLVRMLEHDTAAEVRSACKQALGRAKLSHSAQQALGRIGAQAETARQSE